ncbi:MAG: hypothetical protein H0T48_00965 [Gemmatimonadaceae bacterium]|nr:hypothetical protein [Gemmatimonadaceae bacterium]
MSAKTGEGDPLFATAWVHVFEEDTEAGAVYRPEDADIPLSRRPRERIKIDPDGSARLLMPGPDDRYVEQPATWKQEGDVLVIRTREGSELQIGDRSPARLVAKKSSPRPPD